VSKNLVLIRVHDPETGWATNPPYPDYIGGQALQPLSALLVHQRNSALHFFSHIFTNFSKKFEKSSTVLFSCVFSVFLALLMGRLSIFTAFELKKSKIKAAGHFARSF
jgi:hypothetical protein